MFTLFGEMIQFDEYFSDGLVQPPSRLFFGRGGGLASMTPMFFFFNRFQKKPPRALADLPSFVPTKKFPQARLEREFRRMKKATLLKKKHEKTRKKLDSLSKKETHLGKLFFVGLKAKP